MKGKKLFSQVFNPRLFLEGLKRLRVVGLATAILSLTVTALVPIAVWMIRAPEYNTYTHDTQLLCVPVGILVFMAPMFLSTLFSFLKKRKESDFFHAIPYTRTCVYVSFTAAALAFVFAIQAACGVVAGILWGLMPNLSFDLGGMIAFVFICMLAAAMLSSFMMLALTVSGTGGSCTLLFVLFAGFVRVVCAIFLGCVDTIWLIPTDSLEFFSPTWFLPLSVIYYFGEFEFASSLIYSLPNILYSLTVTLGIFALAGVIYKHRKSEMAGNPAPGVRTQALFRIMFALLLALLIPLLVIRKENDSTLFMVLIVAILLVYFLYELITTKRPKNMLKAIPGLGIVAAVCIFFGLAFTGYRTVILYEKIDAEDIKSVSVEADLFGNSYQGRLMDTYHTTNDELCELIAEQLEDSQIRERESERGGNYSNRTTVTIRLKGGRTIRRNILLTYEHTSRIVRSIMEEERAQDALYQLPALREIDYADIRVDFAKHIDYMGFADDGQIKELMSVFRDEFNSLTDEQKNRVMAPTLVPEELSVTTEEITLTLTGRVDRKFFRSEYLITEDMPITRRYLLIEHAVSTDNWYSFEGSDQGTDHKDAFTVTILNYIATNLDRNAYEGIDVTVMGFSATGANGQQRVYYNRISEEKLSELIALLSERNRLQTKEMIHDAHKKVFFTDDTYCVHLILEGHDNAYRHLSVNVSGLYELTLEDWKAIEDILADKTPS